MNMCFLSTRAKVHDMMLLRECVCVCVCGWYWLTIILKGSFLPISIILNHIQSRMGQIWYFQRFLWSQWQYWANLKWKKKSKLKSHANKRASWVFSVNHHTITKRFSTKSKKPFFFSINLISNLIFYEFIFFVVTLYSPFNTQLHFFPINLLSVASNKENNLIKFMIIVILSNKTVRLQ